MFLLCDRCGWRSAGVELQQNHRRSARPGADDGTEIDMGFSLFSRSSK